MRVLVLYVDRDGDLKAQGFETPVVGRDEVLRLAIRYILANPDDSDANAIFAAVKIYDKLSAEYGPENINVAVVSGSPDPAVADVVVVRELETVLSLFDADVVYFVSDGPSDEAAVPAIQAKRPVMSVYRVVVKQARGVEETVTLFRYYLSKAVKEPEYRRYTVGIPALLAFITLLGATFNMEIIRYILNIILLFFAFFIMLYGFGIYDFLREVLKRYEITFIITLVAMFVIVLYLFSLFIGESWIPYYLLLAASILPYVSYITEAYFLTKRVKFGGIIAGGLTFSFFYFLFPLILNPRKGLVEILTAVGEFLAFVFAVVLAVYIARSIRK
ncbi:conserved hypothetical protein [Pyrobaculum aerophilum str. IM2]|uniref:DUF373 family protein n=2 Tax=Pyrobaculum aerophilum TaxID=13773 RepID=Q8ZWT0_PYRAE|nr:MULTISPECIES: DUF373 family protein [Pyrobaculum]AAL63619.1 conserved hypothetical protein [Pyrobaculum aerophilum str. IM2]HII46253.1 DUF373 family protein [Pyrobaculum aerophilum]